MRFHAETSNLTRSLGGQHHSSGQQESPQQEVWGTFNNLPMTVGSRSTNTALGTCFPEPVSLKKVPKEESVCPEDVMEEMMPSD